MKRQADMRCARKCQLGIVEADTIGPTIEQQRKGLHDLYCRSGEYWSIDIATAQYDLAVDIRHDIGARVDRLDPPTPSNLGQ